MYWPFRCTAYPMYCLSDTEVQEVFVGLFRPNKKDPAGSNVDAAGLGNAGLTEAGDPSQFRGPAKKDRPTPTRKQAEAARRERITPVLNKKQARKRASQTSRAERVKTMTARDNTPEKILLRDYVDARWNLGEFLLPSLVIILALTFLNKFFPAVTLISTVLMYLFILLVLFDGFLMWRGYKKVLAQRHPRAGTKGLVMYGMNRAIQIRRFRIPSPRIKRGQSI